MQLICILSMSECIVVGKPQLPADYDACKGQPAARVTPPKITRRETACPEVPKATSVDSLSEMSYTSGNDLFEVHWPPTADTATEAQSPELTIQTCALSFTRSKGKHASDEGLSKSQPLPVAPGTFLCSNVHAVNDSLHEM